MKLILSIGLAFGVSIISLASYAQECTEENANTENAAEYLSKMAESLVLIKIQFDKMNTSLNSKKSDAIDFLVAFKELKAGYFCSSNMIESYKKSKIDSISKSADALAISYRLLGSGVDESIEFFKSNLDQKIKLSPGESADQSAEKMIRVKKQWELAINAIALGTFSALGKENSKTKKMDTLLITRSECNKVIKILRSHFPLIEKRADSFIMVDAAAKMYFNFLTQPWKFTEKPTH